MPHRLPITLSLAACILLYCTASTRGETPKFTATGDPISNVCLRPMKGDYAQPEQADLSAHRVTFTNAAGHKLRGWHIPVEGSTQSILFCMGNTGNISLMLPYAKILQQAGYDVMLFDYQGYGESEGVAGVSSLLTDSLAAFDFLKEHTGRTANDIGVFGVSLGSILAITVAAEKQAGAAAVEDAFIPNEMLDRFSRRITGDNVLTQMTLQGMKTLLLGRVDPLRNVAKLKCPVFFLHGERDRLLPPSGTWRIAAEATTPKRVWLIPKTGHAPESLETNDQEYAQQLATFFQDAFAGTVNEPQIQLKPIAPSDGDSGDAAQVTVTANGKREKRPMMLAVVDERGRRYFQNFWLSDTATITVETRFAPLTAFAIRYHYVTATGDSWEPELSPYSRALARYHQHASGVLNGSLAADYLTRSNGLGFSNFRRLIPRFPSVDAAAIMRELEALDMAPDRIKARYARLLARLHCWPAHRMGDSPPEDPAAFGEAMLKCLPADPDTYYELQNGGMQLSFRDTIVGDSLFRLAKLRLKDGKPEEARELLRQHVAVLPEGFPTNLTEERIQSVSKLSDLTDE